MRGLKGFEGRTVVVHNAPAPSLQGVLLHAHRDCLVIAHGRSLDDKADLGGELVVPRSPGVWLQLTVVEPTP
jgi:hypothetical protein